MLGRLRSDERGTVTAEFAIVLPAVVLVLGVVIGAVLLAAFRVTLISAAAEVARLEARGDRAAADARIAELGEEVEIDRSAEGPLHCVVLSASPGSGALAVIGVSARACAAAIGTGGAS